MLSQNKSVELKNMSRSRTNPQIRVELESNFKTDSNVLNSKKSKKLKKIEFLTNQTKNLVYNDSPFIHKKQFNPNEITPHSYKSKYLRKADSFAFSTVSKESTMAEVKKVEKIDTEQDDSLNKKSKKANYLKSLKKKMKIRSYIETKVGYDPTKEKVNQDRAIEHEFKILGTKIRFYAVADGHGKKKFFLNFKRNSWSPCLRKSSFRAKKLPRAETHNAPRRHQKHAKS